MWFLCIINNNIYNIIFCGIAVAVEWLYGKHTEQTVCPGIPFRIKCFALRYFNVNIIQPLSLLLQ